MKLYDKNCDFHKSKTTVEMFDLLGLTGMRIDVDNAYINGTHHGVNRVFDQNISFHLEDEFAMGVKREVMQNREWCLIT